ncbi:GNAT family N-acetyltransferase [Massilia sp. W12]|uniref:GNAT family N-acetyltransferase n=1 Tax=Massilia sp. W12 TaxID=3126507 RepID=UPI0030CCD1DC
MQNTSEIIISRLRVQDAVIYRELMLQAYATHPDAFTSSVEERAALPLSWWEQCLATGEAAEVVFGAWLDARLLGVAGLAFSQRAKTRHKADVFGMYVSPEARGLGLGKLLLQALEHAARARGVQVLQLTVTDGNAQAQALYRACGFIPFGLEPMAVRVGQGFVAKEYLWRRLQA